jgi:microcystin-dependent protein
MVATPYKAIDLPTQSVTTTWGDALNNGPFADIDSIIGGIVTKTLSNVNVLLTAAEAKNAIIRLIGTLTGPLIVTIPNNGLYAVQNATTGNFQVFVAGSAGAAQEVPRGVSTIVHIDATNGAFVAGARTSTVGMLAHFVGTTVPGGWLECDGSLISRTAYAALWTYAQASGNIQSEANWSGNSMYGAFSTGDTTTTFRIPDLRGQFMRNWSHAHPSTDPGRICGKYQDPAVLNHAHPITMTDNHFHYQFNTDKVTVAGFNDLTNGNYPVYWVNISGYYVNYQMLGTINTPSIGRSGPPQNAASATCQPNTGGSATDNRPVNNAQMYCISYL